MSKKITLVWPAQAVITESLFRHFSMLAEVAGYLNKKSKIIKEINAEIEIEDCAVVAHTAMNMARIVHESDVIALAVNMNNVKESIDTANFFKSVDKNKKIVVYGEAIACGSSFFANQSVFDYVVDSGQFELGIEVALYHIFQEKLTTASLPININDCVHDGNLIRFSKNLTLPETDWGIPQLDLLPIKEYLRIGNGELHITTCKGCPYDCEFCNEKYVSSHKLRYRPHKQIVEYLTETAYAYGASSVYLDASTFTYNREWVIELCNELISSSKKSIPWKTCTRLDCLDEELISLMAKAGCIRISVGVESISKPIQNRISKKTNHGDLISFSQICHQNGIIPRALLIIGLKGQRSSEIYKAEKFFQKLGIQTRFRVLQDFSFMTNGKNKKTYLENFERLNRWLISSPFEEIDINEIRKFEYPFSRNKYNFS